MAHFLPFPAGRKRICQLASRHEKQSRNGFRSVNAALLGGALFDSGSSIGAAITPYLTYSIYSRWGWRPAFMLPGALSVSSGSSSGDGFIIRQKATAHPARPELRMIVADKRDADARQEGTARRRWRRPAETAANLGDDHCEALPTRFSFSSPEWFPIYLVAKGIELKASLIAVSWIPFLAADAG